MSFQPIRQLLNPKFDGYKLSPVSEADAVASFQLPGSGISQSTVSPQSHLSFPEVQSRIRHNHLAIAQDEKSVCYIDKDGQVILITLDEATLTPSFHPIFDIPNAIQICVQESHAAEYPSAVSLAPDIWIVSDGTGRIYVLRPTADPSSSTQLIATAEITADDTLIPFRLHSASLEGHSIRILISHRTPGASVIESSKAKITFDLAAYSIPLPNLQPTTTQVTPLLLWKKRGSDIPSYVALQDNLWLVATSSPYRDIETPAPAPAPLVLSPSEIAPIPRANENLDNNSAKPPPPYSWTQTSDSITVVFPLPSSTPKSHIHVNISPKYLTVLIQNENPDASLVPLPRFAMRELWGTVDRSTSLWTWDKEGDRPAAPDQPRTVGLLTLHLEKAHEGTRWPHVFALAGKGTEDAIEEVPETIDPSEMYKIREALEKYTAALSSGEDPSGLALGSGMPSLAQGEMDESVDESVGRHAVHMWFSVLDGVEAPTPFVAGGEVLAFPLPVAGEITEKSALVMRNTIDGLLYEAPVLPGIDGWIHVATFPALAFVLASKRDTKFVFHVGKDAVLAFESGGREARPNLYVYHDAKGKNTAKQSLVRIGSGGLGGGLLGVGGLKVDRKIVLVCLRERELAIIRGIV